MVSNKQLNCQNTKHCALAWLDKKLKPKLPGDKKYKSQSKSVLNKHTKLQLLNMNIKQQHKLWTCHMEGDA